MVNIENINDKKFVRFINRSQLEEMEGRLSIVPPFSFFIGSSGSQIFVNIGEKSEIILSVHRLGCVPFYKHARDDIELLINHVKSADEENDYLIEENKKLKAEIEALKSKNNEVLENKGLPETIESSIFSIEDALWNLNEIDVIKLKSVDKNDLQTSKELLESGRNLLLTTLKNVSKL